MSRYIAFRKSLFAVQYNDRVRCRLPNNVFRQVRGYGDKTSSPIFNANRPPHAKQTFPGAAETRTETNKQSETKHPKVKTGLRRYGITPMRVILFSLLTYGLYRLNNWQINPKRSLVLNGKFFTPFVLERKDYVSSTSSILHLLSVPAGQNTYNIAEAWRLGVWSVQVMQPELQIARSYTPLPPNNKSSPEQLPLLVRREPHGEVSGFLHRLSLGSLVHLRGPYPEYVIPENVDEVVFLAGGTGIAPALQIIYSLYYARDSPPEKLPKMRILWANRMKEDSFSGRDPSSFESIRDSISAKARATVDFSSSKKPLDAPSATLGERESDILDEQTVLIQELEAMRQAHKDKIQIEYFVDEENRFITEALLRKHLTTDRPKEENTKPEGKKILLVSGPDGFVSTFAGPKGMRGGRETQGPLGGVLDNIKPEGWSIWKL